MKMLHKIALVSLSVGALVAAGCSSNTPSAPTGSTTASASAPDHTGTISMNLQLGPSISLDSVQYVITNPTLAGFTTITGTVDVSNSQDIGFSLTLPAAGGFTLALAATDSAGDSCSAGPVTFQVIAGQSTGVGLTLECSRTVDGGLVGPDVSIGTVTVTADASLQTTVTTAPCAAASALTATPNEVSVGYSIALTGAGIDPNGESSDVSLAWAGVGGAGSLTATTGTTNTFLCQSPGTETITITASINGGASCPTDGSLSVIVTCAAVEAGGGGADAAPDATTSSSPDAATEAGAVEADAAAEASSTVDATTEAGSVEEADAASEASSAVDSAAEDAGTAGDGATAALAPCTTAGQANCITCTGNASGTGENGGLCTPTEAALVQIDITAGTASAAGNAPTNGCYYCMFQEGCIDDTVYGDSNNECGDPLTVGTAAQCLATQACIISSGCASSAVVNCYCGTAPSSGTCNNSAPNGAANGVCDSQIAAGDGFAVDDGHNNLVNLENTSYASGKADQMFQCAISNNCTACLQ